MFIFKKILICFTASACLVPLFSRHADAYQVSGAVEFTYTMYSSQIGDVKTSSQSWTENYSGNIGGFVYDPRLLIYRASVGYSRNHLDRSPDSDTLNYNIAGTFFGSKPISWDLMASQGTMKSASPGTVGEYEVTTTTYGGNLYLRLSRMPGRFFGSRNNNNYYNNNNNNGNNLNNNGNNNGWNGYGRGITIPLPDIHLSFTHQEASSDGAADPINETRDIMTASMAYRFGRSTELEVRSTVDEFEDLNTGARNDNNTQQATLKSTVFSHGELKIDGRRDTRESFNMQTAGNTTADLKQEAETLTSDLIFKPVNRFSHAYRYAYSFQAMTDGTEYTNHAGSGRFMYALLPELSFNSGLAYYQSEFFRPAMANSAEVNAEYQSAGLFLGAAYVKTHTPEFLDPFVLHTGYDFSAGVSSLTDATHDDVRGRYYQNTVNLGLRSAGWKYETAYLDFNYTSKRDHSPLSTNSWSESFNLGLVTNRIPRTSVTGNAAYSSQESSTGAAPGVFTGMPPSTSQTGRSLTYSISADHTLTDSLSLNAGASRAKTNSSASYTLSNMPGTYDKIEERRYVGASFRYELSRFFTCRAAGRAEKRSTEPTLQEYTTYSASAGFDYRIRKLVLSSDYRFREEISTSQLRVREEVLFLKLSRPF